MTEQLGRFGWYLACSLYPEHSERRSLPKVIGDDAALEPGVQLEGVGTQCPACGIGKLAQRRSRFGYFLGCDRYPECRFIPKPEVPEEYRLGFDAPCPVCGPEQGGKLGPKRNNKRNTYFYSCDRYPDCKTIRPRPTGATHADCGAVIGRDDTGGICTRCGARVDLPEGDLVGHSIAGGTPDPMAFAPKRPRRAMGETRSSDSKSKRSAPSKGKGTRAKGAGARRKAKKESAPTEEPAAPAAAIAGEGSAD